MALVFNPSTEFAGAARELCYEIAEEIALEARLRAPVDTGELSAGYHAERTADGAEVVTDVEYWASVEYGALPHDIPNAWGSGRTVRHPGQSAQPHVRPAIEIVAARRRG